MMKNVEFIEGGLAVDDRGKLAFCNALNCGKSRGSIKSQIIMLRLLEHGTDINERISTSFWARVQH